MEPIWVLLLYTMISEKNNNFSRQRIIVYRSFAATLRVFLPGAARVPTMALLPGVLFIGLWVGGPAINIRPGKIGFLWIEPL